MDGYSREGNRESSRVVWILCRGLAMCKKMLVAGIVILSAPIVLPPLVVASALGFVVCLPCWMILASYTWSEKLLNKLLPGTSCDLLEEDCYALVYREADEGCEFRGAVGKDEVQEMRSDETKEDIEAQIIPGEEPRDEVIQGLILTVEANEDPLCDSGAVEASSKMTHVVSGPDLASTNRILETNLDQKVILPSPDKDTYTEEGIWQKIDAMRLIMGYKATRQASCMEELRAMYIFTGVEPPASFKNASDLKEAKEKLHFLLSVVGVE